MVFNRKQTLLSFPHFLSQVLYNINHEKNFHSSVFHFSLNIMLFLLFYCSCYLFSYHSWWTRFIWQDFIIRVFTGLTMLFQHPFDILSKGSSFEVCKLVFIPTKFIFLKSWALQVSVSSMLLEFFYLDFCKIKTEIFCWGPVNIFIIMK